MSRRDETVPEDLLMHLRRTIPGFKKESSDCQLALARMVWVGATKHRKHHHFNGAMSFNYMELNQFFGRGQFKAINARLNFFKQSKNWSMSENWTKGYWFSEIVIQSREEYLNRHWRKSTRLLMANGAALKTIPSAIASKDINGTTTTAWSNIKHLNRIKVDLSALRRLHKWLRNIRDNWREGRAPSDLVTTYPPLFYIEQLTDLTSQIIRLAKVEVSGHGYITQRYLMVNSGRLYAQGINLQTVHSLIKQAALSGLWEYDFSNCHFTIMQKMAEKYDYQCKAINNYLANKKSIRQMIAEEAGISIEQAKSCLLAIMYGAKASERNENAIPKDIGQNAAKRLYQVGQFNEIKDDIAGARSVILKNWKRTANGSLTNAFGKAISGTARPVEQIAHLIQGVEATALRAAIDPYPDHIVLLQHDGFAASSRLNTADIMEAVFRATGYWLNMEESTIQIDPDAQFLKNRIQNETIGELNAGVDLIHLEDS
jgi:hypothetical protein